MGVRVAGDVAGEFVRHVFLPLVVEPGSGRPGAWCSQACEMLEDWLQVRV